MRISLLYNENAGTGLTLTELRHVLERHGHEVAHAVEKDAEFERALDGETELFVAAGGDGTVWRAATALIGQRVPLAILPMGTANNIATSLGIDGDLHAVIESWATAHRRPFDAGTIEWAASENRFVEGLGAGLMPAAIAFNEAKDDARGEREEQDVDEKLARALQHYVDVLSRLRPARCTITLDDDERIEGEFLLLEVLNIRAVGANLVFSPDADPSDGLFDVVMAGEAERPALLDYLRQRLDGRDPVLHLPLRRAHRIELDGLTEMHIDDSVRRADEPDLATIYIEPAALHVLVPKDSLKESPKDSSKDALKDSLKDSLKDV